MPASDPGSHYFLQSMYRREQIILAVLQLLGTLAMFVFTLLFSMQSTYEFARDGEHQQLGFWALMWTALFGILTLTLGASGLGVLLRGSVTLQVIILLLSIAAAAALLTLSTQTLWISSPIVAAILIQALATYRSSPPKGS